jgi:hypothetical protein
MNFILGEYGRIYKGELIDNPIKCLIKSLQTDNATPQNREEYTHEIESKTTIQSFEEINFCLI